MIAIIDYGMGNLRSVQKALEQVGAQAVITHNIEDIQKARRIVLPGVGAIRPAMIQLSKLNIIQAIKEMIRQGRPFLGICLGFQLLFEKSFEGGEVEALGILKGNVKKFDFTAGKGLKVPHMGWNQIQIKDKECPLFKDFRDNPYTYFCHSYYVEPADPTVIATSTDYGVPFTSSVVSDNVFGVQFHPEKSQDIGLKILKNFVQTGEK